MPSEMISSWATLMALGAFHGINPGMGWLFAVALGMQEARRGAVLRALVPLGVGHALAVAVAVGAALAIGFVIPLGWLRWLIAGVLISLGVLRLFRHKHPRWGGMRVSMGGLTVWSFLMATAHGAGLMVVPVFMGMSMPGGGNPRAPYAWRCVWRGRCVLRHRPARCRLSGGDRVCRGAGVRKAWRRHPAPRVVQS